MKVHIPGKTPMERLTEFTKRVIAVPKAEVKRRKRRAPRRHSTEKA